MVWNLSASFRLAGSVAAAVTVLCTTVVLTQAEPSGPLTPASVRASGQTTFLQFCAACHGIDGRGMGPVARYLLKDPPDLTHIRSRRDGTFPREALESSLLATGPPATAETQDDMMLWGPLFISMDASTDAARVRVQNLLDFIESIQQP
ncbi:MAG: cytochrome c [Acidobacteria bacterium]|nr:cytochrome c [Acidobacteriota bacterium]